MRNITLISTYHEEKGLCSVAELHQILERARPEVIFLEIPPSCFEQFFKEKNKSNLESDAVNRYLEMHNATEPVLVDVCEAPNDLIARHERLHREVAARSPEYGRLLYRNSQSLERYGFAYLNSTCCIAFWSDLNELVKVAVEKIGEEELSGTYQRWKDVHEHREQEMLKNIQRYSEAREFDTGIFLIGAAHRGSTIEKLKNLSLRLSVTLNWNFENYEGLIW